MRTPRVFIDQKLTIGSIVNLPKDTSEHLVKVIKRKAGNNIILFNGQPDNDNQYGEYLAEITEIKRNNIQARIIEYTQRSAASKPQLELAQCISKSAHFEITLQKSVELGVNIITPIISKRSEQNTINDNLDKKITRWQKIIYSACEQCGRTELPILNPPIDFGKWLKTINSNECNPNNTLLLTLCTKTNNNIHHLDFKNPELENIRIIIGPEGGLDNIEIQLLEQNKFNLVKLGQRIMRTETAGIAGIAIVQFLAENL